MVNISRITPNSAKGVDRGHVGDERHRDVRSDDHAGQQVAENHRQPDALAQHRGDGGDAADHGQRVQERVVGLHYMESGASGCGMQHFTGGRPPGAAHAMRAGLSFRPATYVSPGHQTQSLRGATVLVTGGAGFVGSSIAMRLAAEEVGARVVAFDNLRRRGSELNVPRLTEAGVEFRLGDVRSADELALDGRAIDLIVECAAEPSVLAGYGGGSRYVVDANLGGLVNCLELARERKARMLFLSTSRVYPIALVNQLAVVETESRFALADQPGMAGASASGISEDFSLRGVRTLYGTTKLAGSFCWMSTRRPSAWST